MLTSSRQLWIPVDLPEKGFGGKVTGQTAYGINAYANNNSAAKLVVETFYRILQSVCTVGETKSAQGQ
jgi:hypothetical protein